MKDYRDVKGPGLNLSKEECQYYELNEYNYAIASLVGFIKAVCNLYRDNVKSASIAMEEIVEAFDSKDNFLTKILEDENKYLQKEKR